jgi:hypothetical protein
MGLAGDEFLVLDELAALWMQRLRAVGVHRIAAGAARDSRPGFDLGVEGSSSSSGRSPGIHTSPPARNVTGRWPAHPPRCSGRVSSTRVTALSRSAHRQRRRSRRYSVALATNHAATTFPSPRSARSYSGRRVCNRGAVLIELELARPRVYCDDVGVRGVE